MYVGRREDGRFECYYRVHGSNLPGDTTAYAVSDDGIHWDKPNLRLVEGTNGKDNNLFPSGAPFEIDRYGNVTDPDKQFVLSLEEKPLGHKMQVFFARQLPD